MKTKKYRNFLKKEISFIKFFNLLYKKIEKIFKKYKKLWDCEIQDINYCDVYSNSKEKFLFKKINIYNTLVKIFKNEESTLFFLTKNKKTYWSVSYYDETSLDYDGQPCGTCGITITNKNKHNRIKNLKLIFDNYN